MIIIASIYWCLACHLDILLPPTQTVVCTGCVLSSLLEVGPDLDSDNLCRACDVTFTSGRRRRQHLCLCWCIVCLLPRGRVPVFYMRCQLVETNKRLVLLPSWVLVLCLGQFFVFFLPGQTHFPILCTIPHVRSTCFIHLPPGTSLWTFKSVCWCCDFYSLYWDKYCCYFTDLKKTNCSLKASWNAQEELRVLNIQ